MDMGSQNSNQGEVNSPCTESTAHQRTPEPSRNPVYSLTLDEISGRKSFGSMNAEDFLNSIFATDDNQDQAQGSSSAAPELPRQGSLTLPEPLTGMTVDQVWSEIHRAGAQNPNPVRRQVTLGEITLEDFLVRAGIVRPAPRNLAAVPAVVFPPTAIRYVQVLGAGSPASSSGVTGGVRNMVVDAQTEKVIERRNRRMIKNRESAARSRARKQAYTFELEAELNLLKEDNEQLKRDVEESEKKRRLQCEEYAKKEARSKTKAQRDATVLRATRRSSSCDK